MSKRIPQRYRILNMAINSGPSGFTRSDAAIVVGCYELASRIGELEAEGVEFEKVRMSARNRYGDPVRYVNYRLRYCPLEVARKAGA
jgi:hypothetical protein